MVGIFIYDCGHFVLMWEFIYDYGRFVLMWAFMYDCGHLYMTGGIFKYVYESIGILFL